MIAKYTYDPFGRRISKKISGTKTYYLYSDEGLIGEYDATGTEIKTYGYKPNSAWTTDPLFCHSREGGNPEYYFYHNDHLGTPQKMTDISGAVVWSATYDAFGKATVDGSSSVTNNLRFPGQYADQETGLHYNGARYYAPDTGRYMSRDPLLEINPLSAKNVLNPIKGNFAHPISLYNILSLKKLPILFHPYLYGRTSPLNYKDPTGYSASCNLCRSSCAVGGVAACHEVCWWMILTGPEGVPAFLLCEIGCEIIAELTCENMCTNTGACCKK